MIEHLRWRLIAACDGDVEQADLVLPVAREARWRRAQELKARELAELRAADPPPPPPPSPPPPVRVLVVGRRRRRRFGLVTLVLALALVGLAVRDAAAGGVPSWRAKQIAAAQIIAREARVDPWPNCPDPVWNGAASWDVTVACENGGSWLDSPGYFRCGLQFAPFWERRFGRLCP